MKLRIATGLGLLLFFATMIGGPVAVSQARNPASQAGKFAGRSTAFFTLCFVTDFSALADCASAPHLVPMSLARVAQASSDEAGNFCVVGTNMIAPLFGTKFPASIVTNIVVGTTTSFDPTTGAGTQSFSQYQGGGSCIGAGFDGTGATQVAAGTQSFVVSDSGNRIEFVVTGFSAIDSAFSVAGSIQGLVQSATSIRQ